MNADARLIDDRVVIDRELCAKDLPSFVAEAWPYVDPQPFVPNWHIDAICEHLEAVTNGDIQNLCINVPPRHAKSLLVSVLWPAWVWIGDPSHRWLTSSYAMQLAVRDCLRARRLMDSGWYQERWGDRFTFAEDENLKSRYVNSEGGHRIATAVGSAVTGEGGDTIIVDDPLNVTDTHSESKRDACLDWWDQAMSTRLNDPDTGRKVIIMQRLHNEDLTGHVMDGDTDYVNLRLPTEYDPDTKCMTIIGFEDPRTEQGELLNPERFNEKANEKAKKNLGAVGYSGQHDQWPSAKSGGMFAHEDWVILPRGKFPQKYDLLISSWDLPFDETKKSDYAVGYLIGLARSRAWVIDRYKKRGGFKKNLKGIKDQVELWDAMFKEAAEEGEDPDDLGVDALLVEKAANGAAILDVMRDEFMGCVPVKPRGAKEVRAAAYSPKQEAGQVILPEEADWREDCVKVHGEFPNGKYDDDVDALGQGVRYLARQGLGMED